MKKSNFLLFIVSFLPVSSCFAAFDITGSRFIKVDAPASSGLESVVVVEDTNGANIAFKTDSETTARSVRWYRFGAMGGGYAVPIENVSIDGTKSAGVTSYMGGIAGQLNVSTGLTSYIQSCIVNGSVKAGTTKKFGDITSGSYIGGMAGANLGVQILDCRTAVSVYGSTNVQPYVLYATGGAFGRIRETTDGIYDMENLIAYGSVLNTPTGDSGTADPTIYTGNFAGIVPKGQDWAFYSAKNIIVHAFDKIEYIGKALDSNNQE